MPWGKCKPVWDASIIGLCGTPYHGHPHGCHNFCTRASCPPTMEPLSICLDDFYLIWIKWPIGDHVRKKLAAHPGWSIYQARNILYWQATARKQLQGIVNQFLEEYPQYKVLGPKEYLDSWGIDMTATIAQLGVDLSWGPDWAIQEWTYVLRYAGTPIEEADAARLQRLRKLYPAVYHQRRKHCAECFYRPCLQRTDLNASMYVSRQMGAFTLQKFLGNQRGWTIRCQCGQRAVVAVNKLCWHRCRCGATVYSPKPSKGSV